MNKLSMGSYPLQYNDLGYRQEMPILMFNTRNIGEEPCRNRPEWLQKLAGLHD